MIGSGALNIKYGRQYSVLWRQTYWDLKDVVNEIITRSNTFRPEIGFSHRDKFACVVRGALRYLLLRKRRSAWTPWDEECRGALAASTAVRRAM